MRLWEPKTRGTRDRQVLRWRNRLGKAATRNQDTIRRFTWVIASINVHLEELRYFWAKTLGISGPQWMILMLVYLLCGDDDSHELNHRYNCFEFPEDTLVEVSVVAMAILSIPK